MASGAAGGDRTLVELSPGQLRKLAELIRGQEVDKLYELKFESYAEQQKYLTDCEAAHENVHNLLNSAETMKAKVEEEKDATKESIANDVYEYCTKTISTSLQFIRSYNTRLTFLDKLKKHCDDLIEQLHRLDPATDVKAAQRLALEAGMYKKAMLEKAKKLQNFVPNQFSKCLKDNGVKFEDLVEEYVGKLGFKAPFKNLTDIEKLEVYEKIIEASGQGKSSVTYSFEALGATGVALLVFTSAIMVWDIYTAENKIETAVRDSVNALTPLVTLEVEDLVNAAVAAGFEMLDLEVASVVLTVTGVVVGFGVGVIIGAAAGALLDFIFSSGSTKVHNTDGLTICRVSPMPNGLELSRLVKNLCPDL